MSLFLLRISLGWMFFYAGITKVLNPTWSAEGFLKGAKLFNPFFNWFLQPGILPITNFVNEWGLTLLGVSLILGIAVRLSSSLGALLMLLYYIPLGFPYPNPNSYIVDQHIIFIFSLLVLGGFRAGRFLGLESWCSGLPICRKFPKFRSLLG
ncbi:MAG: DoxX family protein [Candidatus Paceibacterota bacterium]